MDILIYVPKQYRIETHPKWDEDHAFCSKVSDIPELDKDWEFYWSLSPVPIHIRPGKDAVFFCDGEHLIAVGMIIDKDEKNIYFKSLIKLKYPQPYYAPTRGFTYVDLCKDEKKT